MNLKLDRCPTILAATDYVHHSFLLQHEYDSVKNAPCTIKIPFKEKARELVTQKNAPINTEKLSANDVYTRTQMS